MPSPSDHKTPILDDAISRVRELYAEAVAKQSSCKILVEVTFSNGIPQQVQDERRRYAKRG